MELIYCYIKEFNSLKDCELNFGSKYKFNYHKDSNELECLEYEDYVESFFPKGISNVTAIVGENGAGKSSVMEFIIRNLTDGNAVDRPEAIIIKWDKISNVFHAYVGPSFLDVKVKESISFKRDEDLQVNVTEAPIIYYTNSFYDRISLFNFHGLHNISLNSLVQEKELLEAAKDPVELTVFEGYRKFNTREYWRIIRFMQSGLKFEVDFRLPNYLILSVNPSRYSNITGSKILFDKLRNDSYKLSSDDIEKFAIFTNRLFSLGESKSLEEEFLDKLQVGLLFDHIRQNPKLILDIVAKQDFYQSISKEDLFSIVLDSVSIDESAFKLISETKEMIEKYVDFVDGQSAWINTSRIEAHVLKEYLTLVNRSLKWDSDFTFFRFGFSLGVEGEFSSGEMALLTMLSRFYSLHSDEQYFTNLTVERDSLIFIDEGELYLHPSWQKKFLNILLSTLPLIFPNVNLQIVLTSHSPFVLSDLPKSKVNFLRKGRTSGVAVMEHKQTFASNIHTLLSDTFFMDTGFIGDFAKKIIDQIITELNNSGFIKPKRREEMKRIILSIGEPIIRQKLLQMYNDKINLDVDDRLTALETKLGL